MPTGADVCVASLEACGIDTVFALPGEETNAIMDALAASSIEVVLCRHEQSAAFMASTHGRLTGKPAVCLATLGPGATNLMTGVADAQLDCVPLLAITGQAPRARLPRGQDSHQVIDLGRLFDPVTQRSETLMAADDIPGAVAEALCLATAPRPGAVHLSLPEDVAAEQTKAAPIAIGPMPQPFANPSVIADAVSRLMETDRVMLLAGAGVDRAGAASELASLIQNTGLPAATSFMAKGCVPTDAPSHLGAFGLPVRDHVDAAIASADLLLTIGLDPVEYPLEALTGGETPVIAISETRMPKNLGAPIDIEMIGDIAASLDALDHALKPRDWQMWETAQAAHDALRADRAAALEKMDDRPPPSQALVAALNTSVDRADTVLSGVGTHKLAMARDFAAERPGQILIGNGLAGMGLALPGAIAAARLQSEGRVIAVCGDGDVMMNVQEMETAHRLGLDLTVIVWVDGGYGLIEDKQEKDTGTRPDLSFGAVGWSDLARSFGWTHHACDTAADLQERLTAQRGRAGQHLITVPVRYDGALA
jgi:acetolactate synthase-1/2/3 large subunit